MIVDVAKSSLETHHASLENKLLEELKSPQPDQKLISALKKQKLRLKDEMLGINA
jgi:hypothetical protein